MSSIYNLFQTSIHADIHSPRWVVSPVWEILDPPLHTIQTFSFQQVEVQRILLKMEGYQVVQFQ